MAGNGRNVHTFLAQDAWSIGLAMRASLNEVQQGPGKDNLRNQPKAEAEISEKRGELAQKLLPDAVKGKWSDESKKLWQKYFTDVSSLPGATEESVREELGRLGAEVNNHLPAGHLNKVGMAIVGGKNGESIFLMGITPEGKFTSEDVQTTMAGRGPDTIVRAGSFKPAEQQEARPGDGRPARPGEQPNNEAALRREAEIAGKQLLKDGTSGEWSIESIATWQKLFESATDVPGFTPDTVGGRLAGMAELINKRLADPTINSPNRFIVRSMPVGDRIVFYLCINKPGQKEEADLDAMSKGNNTKTAVRVGTIKIMIPPDVQPRDDGPADITLI
jgi:hypothetical protein